MNKLILATFLLVAGVAIAEASPQLLKLPNSEGLERIQEKWSHFTQNNGNKGNNESDSQEDENGNRNLFGQNQGNSNQNQQSRGNQGRNQSQNQGNQPNQNQNKSQNQGSQNNQNQDNQQNQGNQQNQNQQNQGSRKNSQNQNQANQYQSYQNQNNYEYDEDQQTQRQTGYSRYNNGNRYSGYGNNNNGRQKQSRNDFSQESSEDFSGEEQPTSVDNLKKDGNKFADETLQKLRTKITQNGFNQIALPNDSKEFHQRFYKIRFDGTISLTHGYLKGFENVKRVSEASMRRHANGSVTVSFEAEFGDLEAGYTLDLSFFVLKTIPSQKVKGYLSGVSAQFDVLVNSDGKVLLTDFDFTDAGRFKFQTTGLGQLNFVLDSVVERIGNISKSVLLESTESKFQSLLNAVLNDSLYPVPSLFASVQSDLYSKFTSSMAKLYG